MRLSSMVYSNTIIDDFFICICTSWPFITNLEYNGVQPVTHFVILVIGNKGFTSNWDLIKMRRRKLENAYLPTTIITVFSLLVISPLLGVEQNVTHFAMWKFNASPSWTKWLPFRRRHFQMHFLEKEFCVGIRISMEFVPKGPISEHWSR